MMELSMCIMDRIYLKTNNWLYQRGREFLPRLSK
jgi:hypothetical protein